MEDLLVVKNLVQEFKSHSGFLDSIKLKDGRLIREKKAVHAVNDVSFTIRKGETFGLVGESGCGKSTTAKSIIRLLDCVSGQIIYKDQDISRLKNRQLEPYRKSVQMIFQDPQSSLDPRQQVKDIIMEPMLFHKIAASRKEAEERCLALLERVGLRPEQANRYPHQFSGGHRYRPGTCCGAGIYYCRRACFGVGRLYPSTDIEPDDGSEGRIRLFLSVHRA